MPKPTRSSSLQGAARLAIEATLGVTALVEAVHTRIATPPGFSAGTRSGGLTGLVYGGVRGVTQLVGSGLDAALGLLAPALQELDSGARKTERQALLAALNGVLGEHLAASGNPLAQAMELRLRGPQRRGALLLLHGLCMNDQQWRRREHDHGAMLGEALGLTPVYLLYNSGLPIHANGAALAQQLQVLADTWPGGLQRLLLLGHSMGGLLARSSLHQAMALGLRWPDRVSELVCLGSPHAGAPLERIGHVVDRLLEATPYSAPFARLGKLRSAGITDLRHGRLLADDTPAPLPAGLRSYALAGRLQGRLKAQALGDGLVPVASALGQHQDPTRQLRFSAQAVVDGVGHLDLLCAPAVTAQLREWLPTP